MKVTWIVWVLLLLALVGLWIGRPTGAWAQSYITTCERDDSGTYCTTKPYYRPKRRTPSLWERWGEKPKMLPPRKWDPPRPYYQYERR